MLKNYFKIAWRNLFRNKGFSLTNILGLTIGMTCAIFIFLWVQDELNFDKSQKNYNDIYQVMANRNFNNQVFTDQNMVLPLAQAIKEEIPEIKYAAATTHYTPIDLANGNVKLIKSGYTVSKHFFDIFSVKFIKGNAAVAINDPSSIVLSESAAKALFGNDDPMNKVLKVNNDYDVKVTAIVADMPANTSIKFDYIMPFNYSQKDVIAAMNEWNNSSWNVFIQTIPEADLAAVDKKITAVKIKHNLGDKNLSTYFTFPMNKWRLSSDFKDGQNTGGMIQYVKMFSIIAIIILMIACVNFMNLSTARSEKRAKEVGIRKTLGSVKKQLVLQFLMESIIIAFISFVLSILAVYFLLPAFNILVEKQMMLNFSNSSFWIGAVIIIVFTGVIAGSYPALYLSSFNPVKVLKGSFSSGKKAVLPRRILVVFQFVISIFLISATIIVYQQIKLIKNRDMGYNPNNLITITGSPDTQKNYEVIKAQLLQTGIVNAVTRTISPITEIGWRAQGPDYPGKPADQNIIFNGFRVDKDFTKTMGIKMIEGNDFSGMPIDSTSIILNKAAITAMNIKNPIGMKMNWGRDYTVIGVIDNVIMETPFESVNPIMIFYNPANSSFIDIRLNNRVATQKALAVIETVFKKYNGAYVFDYQFADKEFEKKFLNENLISKLSNIFAALAIFICCLGLAGLASFTIEKRIREIGIRKVLGATVQQLLMLISKEFLKLVLVAFVIAIPITWWFMHNWLQQYVYRIDISIWMFVMVGFIILLLTLIVVIVNTIKTALANPVKSLRTE